MKKKAISAALAGAMLAGTMAVPAMAVNVDEFTDVKSTDWFYPYVQKVAEKDYMIGVGGNLFAPTTQMSRAMFVTVLARLEGVDEENAKSNFDDVPDDTWYTSAVNWAAANGIVEGNGAGQFMPEDEITRQDMCTMMARYVTYHQKKHNVTHVKPGTKKDFTDEDQIADYATKFVEQCVAWGLIEGNDLGQFMPKSFTTRAEAAAVISRLSWRSNGGGGGPTPSTGTTETKTYAVNVLLTLPDELSATKPEFGKEYNVSITTDKDGNVTSVSDKPILSDVAKDLINEDDGSTLTGYINQALNRLQFDDKGNPRTITRTVKGQEITIEFDEKGTISAKAVMDITDMIGTQSVDGISLLQTSSKEDMQKLLEKIQNSNGTLTFSKDEIAVLDDIVAEAKKLGTQAEFEEKLAELKKDNSALKQALEGVDTGELYEAFTDYKEQLETIQTEVNNNKDADGNATVEVAPVKMKAVSLDLGEYLAKAVDEFNDSARKESAIDRIDKELYPLDENGKRDKWLSDAQKEVLGTLYDLNNPEYYVTDNENDTLSLLSANEYKELITKNVTKSMEFYEALGEDAEFYKSLLDRIQAKSNKEGYGLEITNAEGMAAILGDPDCIFVDQNDAFRSNMEFSVSVDTNNSNVYDSWVDLITGKFDQLDGVLPGFDGIPSMLLGDYTLSMTITQK